MATLTDQDLPEVGRRPTAEPAKSSADDDDPPRDRGSLLGRYVLLDRIGVGGMGSVYSAYDPELDRRVALKLLRAGASEVSRARLVREAQAMARVSHPNVITVHDVGTYEHGVFLAMELVEGDDLRTWLRGSKRAWREVMPAFIAAGRGLSAAHAVGLVHRDFKPANVLRGHDGAIRVVDFGLARLTDNASSGGGGPPADAAAADGVSEVDSVEPSESALHRSALASSAHSIHDSDLTRTGTLVGTPAYMAPEQHMRGEIDARTDQFGFCVALFEALYGKRPFAAPNRMALMFAAGRGEIPPPPRGSDVPGRFHALLRRGLQPKPESRWPSMDTLLAELQRNPSRQRRQWFAMAGTISVVGAAAWGLARVDVPAEAPCSAAAARMDGIWDAERRSGLRAAFEQTELVYAPQSADWVVTQLDDWRDAWVTEHTAACEATAVHGEQSDALLDLRMLCLESRRRDFIAAIDLLVDADATVVERADQAVDRLPDVARCANPDDLRRAVPLPDDEAIRTQIADVEAQLARVWTLQVAARYDDASALSEVALARARTLDHPPLLAAALMHRGDVQSDIGQKQEAIETLHEAAEVATVARDDGRIARAWMKLTWQVGLELSRHDEGLRWGRYARAALDRAHADPLDYADLDHSIGTVLWAAGRLDEALAALQRALDVRRASNPEAADVADTLAVMGNVYVRQGQPQAALRAFEAAHEQAKKSYSPLHPHMAIVHNGLGVAHYHLHDLPAAADAYQRAYDVMLQSLGPDHPDLLFSLGNKGNILREQGQLEEALAAMQRVRELVTKTYPAVHREAGMTEHNLGEILRDMGRYREALPHYRASLQIREQVHGPDARYVANTLTGLAETLLALERPTDAVAPLERALEIRMASEPEPEAVARTRVVLAHALVATTEGVPTTRAKALVTAAIAGFAEVDSDRARQRHADAVAFARRLDPNLAADAVVP